MNAPSPTRILLIHPPPATPAMPPLRLAQAVGWLRSATLPVAAWDANLAFHPLAGHAADRWVGVRRDDTAGLLRFMQWAAGIDGLDEGLFTTDAPAAKGEGSAAGDAFQRALERRLAEGGVAAGLLICENAAQLALAEDVVVRLRRGAAEAPSVTVIPPATAADRPLSALLAEAVGEALPGTPPDADFSLTPPSAYAAPQAVLPFAVRSQCNGPVCEPQRLMETLSRWSDRYGVRCFFATDEAETPALAALIAAFGARLPDCHLSLNCRLAADGGIESAFPDHGGRVVQICWRATAAVLDLKPLLYASRAGIWNHLILEGAAATPANRERAALQPNIVHSWETTASDSRPAPAVYTQVRPLPGRPLWDGVRDPVFRFLLAERLGKDRMLRLRVADDRGRVWGVGDDLDFHYCTPDRLPGGYLDEICAMVAAGGTVATTHVRDNLQRAHLIGYVLESGVIVGNSSLKNPRREYIDSVRQRSGLDLTGFVERGYTSVRPEYRGLGIGTKLLAGLTARAGERPIFSVISEDNAATQTIARRNRTRKVATYFSDKAGKMVGIWMPEGTTAPRKR